MLSNVNSEEPAGVQFGGHCDDDRMFCKRGNKPRRIKTENERLMRGRDRRSRTAEVDGSARTSNPRDVITMIK